VLVIGAVLAMALALLIDWLGGPGRALDRPEGTCDDPGGACRPSLLAVLVCVLLTSCGLTSGAGGARSGRPRLDHPRGPKLVGVPITVGSKDFSDNHQHRLPDDSTRCRPPG